MITAEAIREKIRRVDATKKRKQTASDFVGSPIDEAMKDKQSRNRAFADISLLGNNEQPISTTSVAVKEPTFDSMASNVAQRIGNQGMEDLRTRERSSIGVDESAKGLVSDVSRSLAPRPDALAPASSTRVRVDDLSKIDTANLPAQLEQTSKKPILRSIDETVTAAGASMAGAASLGLLKQPKKFQRAMDNSPIATLVGSLVGYALPFVGTEAALVKALPQLVGEKLAQRVIRGGVAGVAVDAAEQGITTGDYDLSRGVLGAGLGVIGDAAVPAIAGWVKKAVTVTKNTPEATLTVMADNAIKAKQSTGKAAQQRERAFFELASEADPTLTREESKQWIDAINEYDGETKKPPMDPLTSQLDDIPPDMKRLRQEIESQANAPDNPNRLSQTNQPTPESSPVKKPLLKSNKTQSGKSENLPVAETPTTPPVEKPTSPEVPVKEIITRKVTGGKTEFIASEGSVAEKAINFARKNPDKINSQIQRLNDYYAGRTLGRDVNESVEAYFARTGKTDEMKEALAARDFLKNNKDALVEKWAKEKYTSSEVASAQPIATTPNAGEQKALAAGVHPNSIKKLNEAMDNELGVTELGNLLHPSNKNLRILFTEKTGVDLPKTVSGTKTAVEEWALRTKPELRGKVRAEIEKTYPDKVAAFDDKYKTSAQPADAGGTVIAGKSASVAESAPASASEGGKKPLLRTKKSPEKPITPVQAAAEVKTEAAATGSTDKSYQIGIRNKDGNTEFITPKSASPVTVKGFEDFDFFVSRDYGGNEWVVSEARTGRAIASSSTRKQAIVDAEAKLNEVGIDRLRGNLKSLEREGQLNPQYAVAAPPKKPLLKTKKQTEPTTASTTASTGASVVPESPKSTLSDKIKTVADKAEADGVGKGALGSPSSPRGSEIESLSMGGKIPDQVSRKHVVDYWEKTLKIPFRTKHFREKAIGVYKPDSQVIRTKSWGDLPVIAHEVGHHIEHTHFGGTGNKSTLDRFKELYKLGHDLYGDRIPNAGYHSEGFSEYIANRMVGNDLTKIAPKFHEYFEGLLKDNPQLKTILDNGQALTKRWYEQGALARVRMSREQGSFAEKVQSIRDSFAQDRFKKSVARFRDLWTNPGATIELFESEARGLKSRMLLDPEKVRPTTSPSQTYRAESFGAQSQARAMVNYGVFDYDGKQTYKSLKEVLKPVSKNIDDFIDYASARRAIDLHDRGINPGIERLDAEFVVSKMETPEFRSTLDDLTTWQNKVLDYLVDAGGMSKEAAEAIRTLNPVYIPFKRVMDDASATGSGVGRKMGDVKSPILKIRGSSRERRDPLQSIIEQTAKIISTANRMRVGRLVVDLAEKSGGMGKWVEKVPMPQEATKIAIADIEKSLREAGVDLADADLDQIITVYQNTHRGLPKDNIVTMWRDGKVETYQLDKNLYQSLMNLDGVAPNVFMKIFGAPAKVKRMFVTGINPAFALTTNPIRDAFTFALQSKYTAGSPHKIVTGLVRKFFPNEANKVYLRSGSDMGQILGMDKNSIKEAVSEVLANDAKAKAMGIVKHPVDALREMLSFTESGPRRAEFEAAYKKLSKQYGEGADARIGATIAGKDVTTDFTRIGKYAQYVNSIIPFFNAQVQGVSKFGRTIAANPKKALSYGLGMTAISTAIWWEQKDEPWYRELPAWRKYGFWNFKVGEHDDGTDYILSIPSPFEWGLVFKAIPEAMLNAHYEQDPSATKEIVGQIATQMVPSLLPAAVEPIIEASSNYDFFMDRQIVPEWMNKNKLPEDQYFESTPKTYRELGKRLGYSPAKLQHLVEGYTGNIVTQSIRNAEQGINVEQPADIPVVGKLFARQYSEEENEEFNKESWERVQAKVTTLTKAGHFDDAKKAVEEWAFKHSAEKSPEIIAELNSIATRQENYSSTSGTGKITLNKKAI